jgi:hypothetical protein
MNDNNTWILLSNEPNSFLLCNIRGSCYVNVDKDHTKIVDHLYQSSNFNTPGSNWYIFKIIYSICLYFRKFKLSKNGNWLLQNIMSEHYLHAFNATHALPMAQFDQGINLLLQCGKFFIFKNYKFLIKHKICIKFDTLKNLSLYSTLV